MRKNLLQFSLLLITTFLFSAVSWGQTTIAGWDVNGLSSFGPSPFAPTTLNSNLTATGLTRGSGVGTGGTAAGNTWGGTSFNSASSNAAITEEKFAFFGITANSGFTISLTELHIKNIRRSGTGPNVMLVQYRIGSGSFIDLTTFDPIGETTNSSGNALNAIDLSEVGALQNVEAGETITFRLVMWNGGSGTWYINNVTGDDLTITGTVDAAAVTPTIGLIGSPSTFWYVLNEGPSQVQSVSVSGISLTNDIVVTPPTNFQISLNQAGPFQTTPITLTQTGGTVAATDIYIRMVTGLAGNTYTGSLSASSATATTQNVTLNGQVLSETLPYFENFGASAGNFPFGWTTSGTGAANWSISVSSASNIPNSSGGANLADEGSVVNEEAVVTINRAISTIGADEVLVSFIARRTSAYIGNVELDYSTDGSTWNNVPFADVANNATWAPVLVSLPTSAANVPNLRLRLRTTRTSTSGNYRIDDFRVLAPSRFIYQTGNLHDLSSWEDADQNNPVDFTSDKQLFVIEGTTSVSTTAAWTVSGSNSRIIVGDGTNEAVLTIDEDHAITGTVQVRNNSILNLNNTTLPTLSGLEDESTVVYGMNAAATIQSVAYGNLTVTNSGTKTFPNSTIAVNGNLVYEDVTLAFAETSSRIDYSGNITLAGTVSYSGSIRPEYRISANSNAQTINTGSATLEAYDFHAQNKTGGSLSLAVANANIRALNNLRLNFPAGVTFNDGGNTIIYGDDLRVQGEQASYTLTGTIELNASGGSNDFEDVVAELNNLRIVTSGDARPRFRDESYFEAVVVIKGNLELEMNSSRDLYLKDVELQIGGDFINNSTSGIRRGVSKLVFNGSSNQEISTSQRLDLHVVEFDNSSATILAGEPIAIRNHLVLTSGNLTVIDNNLVFISDEDFTAYLAPVGATASISGNVETQRYIPAKRAFRLVSSPVGGVTIANSWQQNTHITGAGGATNGFDVSGTNNPSMFTFDNTIANQSNGAAWQAVANTNATNLNAGVPYRLFVRGDKDIDLNNNDAPATVTTLSATGTMHTGDYSPTLATEANNYSFVGNPYQAVVDFKAVTKSNLTDYLYVWDASIAGTNGRGGYTVLDAADGSQASISPFSSAANEYIMPGQAFFVQNTGVGNGSITFKETDKVTTQSQVSIFSEYTNFYINSRLYKTSALQNGEMESDAIGLRFNEQYTTIGSEEDASKFANPGENYAIVNNGFKSIDKQNIPTDGHQVDLLIVNYEENAYSLSFTLGNQPEALKVYLNDSYLATQTELTESTTYNFTVDANVPESIDQNRFHLSFETVALGQQDFTEVQVRLYPNPVVDELQIELPASVLVNSVKIFNLLGQEVIASTRPQVDVRFLSSGFYLVQVDTSAGTVTKKIIKK